MTTHCGHPLCALIDDSCSIATGRSRGCRPNLTAKTVAPGLFEEVRGLVALIEAAGADTARVRTAAIRLAEIIRREAREDRHLLAIAREDEPDLAPALARLCLRQS